MSKSRSPFSQHPPEIIRFSDSFHSYRENNECRFFSVYLTISLGMCKIQIREMAHQSNEAKQKKKSYLTNSSSFFFLHHSVWLSAWPRLPCSGFCAEEYVEWDWILWLLLLLFMIDKSFRKWTSSSCCCCFFFIISSNCFVAGKRYRCSLPFPIWALTLRSLLCERCNFTRSLIRSLRCDIFNEWMNEIECLLLKVSHLLRCRFFFSQQTQFCFLVQIRENERK